MGKNKGKINKRINKNNKNKKIQMRKEKNQPNQK